MRAVAILLLATTLCVSAYNLNTLYKWKYIDYHYPSEEFKKDFIKWGYYNHSNILPTDVNMAPDGRMFVSFYGREGSYIPLATISKYNGSAGPLLEPYPSWEFYNFKEKTYNPRIHSVYKIAFDHCNRMWILDPGYCMDDKVKNYGEPKLYIFDLKTDKIYKEIVFPKEYFEAKRYMYAQSYPTIETHGANCERSYAYIADMYNSHLIVYDEKANKFHRYEDPTFKPDLEAKDFNVAERKFEFSDGGLFDLTLAPTYDDYDSYLLYYRPFTSKGFYALNTTLLRDYGLEKAKFFGAEDYLPEQTFSQGYSPSEGTIFFGLTSSRGLGCWNTYNKNFELNYITKNDERFYYPMSVHIYDPKHYNQIRNEELYVFSTRFNNLRYPHYDYFGNVNFDEYNFFVLGAPVSEVIKGTKCDKALYLRD